MSLLSVDIDKLPKIIKDEGFFKSGSFGSIQRIKWQNRDCAVKYFQKRDNYQKNFSEVDNLNKCNHENIVKLFAAGPNVDEQKLHYYIMEFAPNGSLDELLHKHTDIDYTLAQGLNWVYQCSKGVEYLHTNFITPIIHRDIKPANLLLFNKGRVLKLCDFGTVKSVQNTENTVESGTYLYMAPEVMYAAKERSAIYNEKCDIYSLAIIIWEVLMRQKPFKNTTAYGIIHIVYVKNERLEEISECPPRLQKLIKCCWRKKYKERPNISDVCKVLKLILNQMDNVEDPLPIDDDSEEQGAEGGLDLSGLDINNATNDESFQVQLDLIDESLKPNTPLDGNVESRMIYEQHRSLLNKYVHLHIECQSLEWSNNEILNDISGNAADRDRIKKYCELKIKQEQQHLQ